MIKYEITSDWDLDNVRLELPEITIQHDLGSGENVLIIPVIYLVSAETNTVATQVALQNIRAVCTDRIIDTENCCWGNYVDALVFRKNYSSFNTQQKDFVVNDCFTHKPVVWNGSSWVDLSIY